MSDIEEVLAGFVPIGVEHPVAQQTRDAVIEHLAGRGGARCPACGAPLKGDNHV